MDPDNSPTITAGLNQPNGVAVDANGKIYVVNSNELLTTYKAGGAQTTPTIGGVLFATGVAVY